ncbi:MAG: helix-turn-helix transcriptional regulator [Arcicella sp.]|nr:helix-turn-helix transcriptional regulator [Arcicella sp.]
MDKALKNYGTLSATEKKVLGLIAALNTTKQIANELFISLKTAEGHRFNIRKKLCLSPKNSLTEIAIF